MGQSEVKVLKLKDELRSLNSEIKSLNTTNHALVTKIEKLKLELGKVDVDSEEPCSPIS